MSKQQEAWNAFASGLSPQAKASLIADKIDPLLVSDGDVDDGDEATDAYQQMLTALSPTARDVLSQTGSRYTPPKQIAVEKARYCIIEIPDGEWPRLRIYSSPDAMARRLQKLEGFDVTAWCYYGIPLKISKGLPRFVELPSGYELMRVPPFPAAEPVVVAASEVDDIIWEKRGFMGPAYLADAIPTVADQVPATAGGDEEED